MLNASGGLGKWSIGRNTPRPLLIVFPTNVADSKSLQIGQLLSHHIQIINVKSGINGLAMEDSGIWDPSNGKMMNMKLDGGIFRTG